MNATFAKRVYDINPHLIISRAGTTQDHVNSHNPNMLSECDCCNVAAFIWTLRELQLWPISRAYRTETLGTLLEKLDDFATREFHDLHTSCRDCGHTFDEKVAALVERVRSTVSGLCLDCVRNGLQVEHERKCRQQHKGFAGISVQVL